MGENRIDHQKTLASKKAEYESLLYDRAITRLKSTDPKQAYHVVDTANSKNRKQGTIETQSESKILRPYDRLKMISMARDLERNCSSAKKVQKQFKNHAIGNKVKMQLNTKKRKINKKASKFFNKTWGKNCDSRDDLTFNQVLKLSLGTVMREGDFLVAFDDFARNDGKLLFWEADQLVEIVEKDWKTQKDWVEEKVTITQIHGKQKKTVTKVPMQQSSGVIFDSFGRVHAYAVTGQRGKLVVPLSEATIIPRGTGKLIKNPFRFNQQRGIGDFFASIADIEDILEMKAKELQSAKVASTFGGTIEKESAVEESLIRGGTSPEDLLETADGTEAATSEEKTYDSLGSFEGGIFESMLPGEKFNPLNFDRPNMKTKEFYEFICQENGAGFGLAKAFSMWQAYNSYTAFRGEMLMTWPTFEDWQQLLEDHLCDWIAIKVLNWGMKNGYIPALPEGWEDKISWNWPKMPQVDPVKDNTARSASMKDGFTDFADWLGPDWEDKLKSIAEALEYARKLGLPLSLFETKSGGMSEKPDDNENDNENDDEPDRSKDEQN